MTERGAHLRTTLRGALAALLLVGASGCASAKPPAAPPDPNLICRLSHQATYVDSLKQLPSAIQAELKTSAGAMADRGEFFNAGDVVSKPAPFNRFIRGGQAGHYWFVWYEHGGFAYWHQIAIFRLDAPDAALTVASARAMSGDLCAETDRLLGAPPTRG